MKNAIIAALSLALAFFVLQSLGTFDSGSLLDHNFRGHFVRERETAVQKAPYWLFGVQAVEGYHLNADIITGIKFAVDVVNGQGGILGRPVRLDIRQTQAQLESQRCAIQSFCDNFQTAACFGPPYTADVPSVRCLSQFQGLPLISPLTLTDPNLPKLVPDNYVPLFPPLSLWSKAISLRLAELACKRIVILGPDRVASYGWIYANTCEQDIRSALPSAEVFRFNYNEDAAGSGGFSKFIDLYNENRGLDAIVFAGTMDKLLVLRDVLHQNRLVVPVFGSDLLYALRELDTLSDLGFPLYIPICEVSAMSGNFSGQWNEHNDAPPSFWNYLGAQAVFLTCRAIEEEQGYHPDQLAARVRQLATELWEQTSPTIRFHAFSPQEPSAHAD